MNSTKLWSFFRKFRVFIFALNAFLSLGWTIFLSLFLSREWAEYNITQRAVVIGLISYHGLATILLYLMIVVQFRIWLDAARVAFLLLFETGTIAVFSLLSPDFPCKQFVSPSMCKTTILIIIVGIWTQSGLLFLYTASLAIMTCVPQPKGVPQEGGRITPYDVTASSSRRSSTSSVDSNTRLLRSNSARSAGSGHSHTSNTSRPTNSLSPIRSLTPTGHSTLLLQHTARLGYPKAYRPNSPGSVYSSRSASAPSYTAYGVGRLSDVGNQRSLSRSPQRSQRPFPTLPLPNPFADPFVRSPSSLSNSSYGSSVSEGRRYIPQMRYDYGTMSSVRPLEAQYRLGQAQKSPFYLPVTSYNVDDRYVNTSSPFLQVPTTPFTVQPQVHSQIPSRVLAATPGAHSIHSLAASIHALDRYGAASVPPLPLSAPMYSSSAISPPPSALLPFPSGMHPYGDGVSNKLMMHPGYRTVGTRGRSPLDSPRRTPIDFPIDGAIDMRQWQRDVLGAAVG